MLKNVDFFEKPRIIICEYLRLVEFKLNKEKKLKFKFNINLNKLLILWGESCSTFLGMIVFWRGKHHSKNLYDLEKMTSIQKFYLNYHINFKLSYKLIYRDEILSKVIDYN